MFRSRRYVLGSLLGVAGIAAVFLVFATGAFSSPSPADKVVAAGDKVVVMAPQSGAVLLTAIMKTSKPTDLVLNVSLECTIETTVENVGNSTSLAQGQVRVWTEVDGQIVPVTSVSNPPQNTPPGGDDTDKAVFCERVHQVTFMPMDQNDMLRQYQLTKNANAFNWLRFNVGAGTHTITVKADMNAGPNLGAATSRALVGNRTLVVTPTKMANDAVISNPGTG